ncbi:thermonuclease family protein [Planktothrix agardhii]|uniref:thermonuclease family protein n=1 Tax=Planktothrix agardhii TaxID=1160 RepID=UPI0009DBCE72|nr:thermonuclease family protein [Planktothrix agardhii]
MLLIINMNGFFKALPLLVLVVLGVLTVKGIGTGNREQGTVSKNSPNSLNCEVVKGSIYDGDTLRVKCGEAIAKVRLACVDSREMKMTGGTQDRDFLRSLINKHGSEVAMIPINTDRYGRTVAELILSPGKTPEISIQEELLKSGHAMIYNQYSDCPNIDAFRLAEDIGRSNKAGIWADPNSIPPWEWRKQNKK